MIYESGPLMLSNLPYVVKPQNLPGVAFDQVGQPWCCHRPPRIKSRGLGFAAMRTLRRRPRMDDVAFPGELRDPGDDVWLYEQRRMALIGDHHHIHSGVARLHGLDCLRTQDIGVGAANDHHWDPGERLELSPHVRDRP